MRKYFEIFEEIMKEPEGSPRNLFQPKVSAGIYPFGTPITTRHPRMPISIKLYQTEIDPVDQGAFRVPGTSKRPREHD